MYLCAGALIALILATYSKEEVPNYDRNSDVNSFDNIERSPPHRKRMVIAFLLTTLFWPIVLVLAVSSESFSHQRRLKLTSNDLLHPVNSEQQQESVSVSTKLNKRKNKILIKRKASDNVWAFRTHISKKHHHTMIVEGYALVNNQNEVVDYLVIEEYPEELPALH